MKLVFKNGVDHKEYEFSVVDQETSGMYYCFSINLESDMVDGQYNYSLYDNDDKLVATGLAQIGNFVDEQENHVYSTDETYKQYQG